MGELKFKEVKKPKVVKKTQDKKNLWALKSSSATPHQSHSVKGRGSGYTKTGTAGAKLQKIYENTRPS